MFRGVILSEAKNLAINRINDLRDPSSPSAPQDDTQWAFFSNLLAAGLKPRPSDRPMKATKSGEKSGLDRRKYKYQYSLWKMGLFDFLC